VNCIGWTCTPNGFSARANGTQIDILAICHVDVVLTAVALFEQRSDGWIVGMNQSIAYLSESGEVQERSHPVSRNARFVE
jgi:hypothetical protein